MTAAAIKDYSLLRGQIEPQATIIAIGGGKGGVGKSFISSSLAIFLGHLGRKTLLIDLDLGAGNIHTCLGEGLINLGVNEFLKDDKLTLQQVISPTELPNLEIVTACSDSYDIANIDEQQKSRLMSAIYNYPADFIVLDLSAGTHHSTLDFLMMAQRKIVVMTPEPSSIENAYRFMKSAFYRRLKRYEYQLHMEEQLDMIMRERDRWGVRSPSDLLRVVSEQSSQNGEKLLKIMGNLEFEIILNQCRSLRDNELGPQIKSVCHKYFGVPCQLLGHVEYDNAVWQSLRKKKPLVIEYPHSRLYAQLLTMSRRLVNAHSKRATL